MYITLLPEVVLQHGAHETTAGGRCERVQKQQSGIPVQPLNVNSNDGNLHFLIHLACGGHAVCKVLDCRVHVYFWFNAALQNWCAGCTL